MANQRDTGGDAFPSTPSTAPSGDLYQPYPGMTLRDYFAGQAILGLIANPNNKGEATEAARIAYGIANAMLAERSK